MADIDLHDEVANWMAALVDTDWIRATVVIDRLSELGHRARMPMSRALGDGLFELRLALGPTDRRITYRVTRDGTIVLLTTFQKARNNERREISRARAAATRSARTRP